MVGVGVFGVVGFGFTTIRFWIGGLETLGGKRIVFQLNSLLEGKFQKAMGERHLSPYSRASSTFCWCCFQCCGSGSCVFHLLLLTWRARSCCLVVHLRLDGHREGGEPMLRP